MPLQALCAANPASLCGIGAFGGLVSAARWSHSKNYTDWAAVGRSVAIAGGSGAAGGELVLRGPWGAPTGSRDAVMSSGVGGARTQQHADLLSVQGLRGAYRKSWIVQVSNSEQGQEIVEEKNTQSSEENSGPPVLTIIAGLLVLAVVFWSLGSLVSWIVGLLFKSWHYFRSIL